MAEKTYTTLKIETFQPEGGGLCVLPPLARVEAQAAKLRADEDAIVSQQKDAEATPVFRVSERFLQAQKEAREIAGDKIKVYEFKYRPYTHGEKIEAKRKATTAYSDKSGNEAFRFDRDEFNLRIIAASTGLTTEEVEELNPAIFDYIAEEVFSRTEISPERLSFFATSPTNSVATSP